MRATRPRRWSAGRRGHWVRQPLTERVAAGTLIAAARLLERARHPLNRDQALHLRALDAGITRELPQDGSRPCTWA